MEGGIVELKCDDKIVETLREMEQIEIFAYKNQDFELLASLNTDLQIMRTVSPCGAIIVDRFEGPRFKESVAESCLG